MSPVPDFPSTFKGDLVTPDSADYEAAIARWAVNSKRRAKIVAFVKDAEDISLAVKYARAHNLEIAIKCGGHNVPGSSSTEGGLVIDLNRYMDYAKVDPEKKVGYVGGGALWRTVDKEAIEHDLATVGGTVNHTGVSGLTLGGGYGFLSSSYGLALDNVLEVTIITADGSILKASDKENPDLFWGIRGGGSNFGVVSEFVFQLYDQRRTIFAGPVVFPPPTFKDLVAITDEWWKNADEKEAMLQIAAVGPNGKPGVMVLFFYNGSEAEGRAHYKKFFNLGPVADMAKEIPYEELNALQNAFSEHGQGVYQKGVAHKKPDLDSLQYAYDRVVELAEKEGPTPVILFEYFPLKKIVAKGGDTSAFRRDPYPSILVNAFWKEDTPENVKRGRDIVYDIIAKIKTFNPDMSAEQQQGYGNYDDESLSKVGTDKAKLVFGKHYPRLQELKKKYDPDQVFHKWFPITPAP
ncbi:FAD-binding domain-containing protein [Schizophyllum commune H4-8]|uniref:FAD-binding PCMH-type domain-containing protein n=1 Tax=Schizophyllum commune (strain H4-8 / FGSC 9210) TaxID=578458 RepID=D8PLE1_SCHCM|nr:FAD-binding domain-containing protein [Schizophyllum commune H4-8]KAI5894316.1 FAD-binding domain-containing protein [Schizophyllum commune H4-8]